MPILLPTHNFDKPEPSASEIAFEMAGWGGFGVLVNVVARKLQHKPSTLFLNVAFGLGFATVGYFVGRLERFETLRLQNERDRLVKRRMKQLEEA